MKVLMLTSSYANDGWSRYGADLLEALRAKGVDARPAETPLHAPLSYLRYPWVPFLDLFALQRELRRVQPDVLHIAVEPYALLVPFLPLGKVRIVLTIHGSYSYLPSTAPILLRPLYILWYRSAIARFARIIAVSEYTKKYFLHKLGKDVPVTAIHNSIGLSGRELQEKKGNKTILTVAPVKARKGIREALRGVAAYVKEHGPVTYRIIGTYDPETSESQKVKEEIALLGLTGQVTFTGRLSEEELAEEYQRADVFLMLPRTREPYFEGFGLVYLEANAYGVPVIASDEGGAPEAVNEGESGYVVPAEDPACVADRLHKILDEKAISSKDARAWALAHDSRVLVEKVLEAYA